MSKKGRARSERPRPELCNEIGKRSCSRGVVEGTCGIRPCFGYVAVFVSSPAIVLIVCAGAGAILALPEPVKPHLAVEEAC